MKGLLPGNAHDELRRTDTRFSPVLLTQPLYGYIQATVLSSQPGTTAFLVTSGYCINCRLILSDRAAKAAGLQAGSQIMLDRHFGFKVHKDSRGDFSHYEVQLARQVSGDRRAYRQYSGGANEKDWARRKLSRRPFHHNFKAEAGSSGGE